MNSEPPPGLDWFGNRNDRLTAPAQRRHRMIQIVWFTDPSGNILSVLSA